MVKNVDLLKSKHELYMRDNNSQICMLNSAPYNRSKMVKKFLEQKSNQVLKWAKQSKFKSDRKLTVPNEE